MFEIFKIPNGIGVYDLDHTMKSKEEVEKIDWVID